MKFYMAADEWYPVLSLEKIDNAYRAEGPFVEASFEDWIDAGIAFNIFEESQARLAEIDNRSPMT